MPETISPATIDAMSSYPGTNTNHALDRADVPRYRPLVIVLAAACAGIAADYYRPLSFQAWLTAGLLWLGIWRLLAKQGYHRAAAGLIFLAVFSAAGAWHHYRWNLFEENDLGNYTAAKKQPVALEAIVLTAPRQRPFSESGHMQSLSTEPGYRIEISAAAIRNCDEWEPVSGRALLFVQGDMPAIEPGDRIRIFGELSAPQPAHNPGEFDRAAFLRSHRIRAQVQSETDCITVVQPGSPWNLRRQLEVVRNRAGDLLQQYLDPKQAELASAVLLGEREEIDSRRNESFMATGTVHILAISGLHVGILAGALLWIMLKAPIPRVWGLSLVALITGLYALMVDVHPPVVRATVLVLMICLSLCLRRPALSFNSLAAAALVVLIINPSDLFSVGAQLSFLAAAAIMWFWPYSYAIFPTLDSRNHLQKMVVEHLNAFSKSIWHLAHYFWELLFIGAMIWMITQPLVAARFHMFSLIALVLNALLWIPITLGLLGGFVFLFVAAIIPPLAGAAAFCCNWILWLLEKTIDLAASVPGGHFWVSGPSNWWLAGFYGGLAVLVVFPGIRPRPRWCFALLGAWTALGLTVSYIPRDSNRLRCTFLSVGHGSAAVLELPSGRTLLYDAGEFGSPERAAKIIAGYLWSQGITRIDAVVISHPDIDHYNALPGVLEKCRVGAVCVSPVMFEKKSSALKELKSALDVAHVPVREIHAGDCLEESQNCRLEVLHPSQNGIPGNDNANSIVVAAEYFGHRIILPGDLESAGLDELLAGEPLHCDVLLAPHHGSRQSNSPGLAAWSSPAWVVLSGDGRWSLPEIDATYQAVGGQTIHTFIAGAVQVTIDKSGTKVETFLKQEKDN